MQRALSAASVLLLVANVAWLWAVHAQVGGSLFGVAQWAAVVVAGCLAALLTESRKVITGTLAALPAAFLFAASNAVWSALGNQADYPGVSSALS
jgi:hypothetical protein